MNSNDTHSDEELATILRECRAIAMIGASPKPDRDSYRVMRYLQQHGYRVLPVNPVAAGDEILGETVYESLAEVAEPYQLVDVFRKPEAVAGIVTEILALDRAQRPRVLWLQLGIVNEDAAAEARAAGIDVVADRCLRIEHERLL